MSKQKNTSKRKHEERTAPENFVSSPTTTPPHAFTTMGSSVAAERDAKRLPSATMRCASFPSGPRLGSTFPRGHPRAYCAPSAVAMAQIEKNPSSAENRYESRPPTWRAHWQHAEARPERSAATSAAKQPST